MNDESDGDKSSEIPNSPNPGEYSTRQIKYARWFLGGVIAFIATYCIINGALTTSTHMSLLHKTEVTSANVGEVWLGFSLLYCAALAGVVKTQGVPPKVTLGCIGSVLFMFTFFAYVLQAL